MIIRKTIIYLLKLILNFLIKIFIFFQGIIKIIFNFRKILKCKNIIFHTEYLGFAHTINIPDFIRSLKKKDEYLYILFFEFGRHNYYQQYLHDINQINIYTSISFNNFQFRIGEYEKIKNNNYISEFLKFLIIKLVKKNTKVFNAHQFWDFLLKKNRKKIFSFIKEFYLNKNFNLKKFYSNDQISYDLKRTVLMHLHCKNNQKYKLPRRFNTKILKKIPNLIESKKKLLTIYIRTRGSSQKNQFSKNRNSDSIHYLETIKYFIKLKWNIIIIGDNYLNLALRFKDNDSLIYAEKFSVSKRLLEIYSMINSNFIISTLGGANMLSFYNHTVYVNMFPIGHIPAHYKMNNLFHKRDDFILNKNVYFKGKKISNSKKFYDIYYKSQLPKEYLIKQNTSNEILNFCKNHYKKYIN